MSALWTELSARLHTTLSLDTEWTIEDGKTLDWWGWFFPTRFELLEETHKSQQSPVTGGIRISTRLGRAQSDGAFSLPQILADWNNDAPGAIAVLQEDGDLSVVCGVPILPGREELAISLTLGVAARQSAYAMDLARLLAASGLLILDGRPHPQMGQRSHPDELVQLYINRCADPFTTEVYQQPEVVSALADMMAREGFRLGFASHEHGVITFELGEGPTAVGLHFDWARPDSFLNAGSTLRIRAWAPNTSTFLPGNDAEADEAAVRANRRVWDRSTPNMLGAWSAWPEDTGARSLSLSSIIPASALMFDPQFTHWSYAQVLQNLLFCVLQQAFETADATHS